LLHAAHQRGLTSVIEGLAGARKMPAEMRELGITSGEGAGNF
jgi:hypothetical protein